MAEKSEIDIAVGRALNRLRGERGLTVTALAEGAGVSPPMISRIEKGQGGRGPALAPDHRGPRA